MPNRPNAFFITGTDTGVGKTHVSVSLVKALVQQGLKVAVMKPIASGSDRTPQGLRNEDALALKEASNVDASYDTLNPYCFEPAISPHIAAEEAGITLDVGVIKSNFDILKAKADIIVVEGAGGWYAPMGQTQSMADLPKALNIPAILVVGVRLGCLNHARLSKEAIEAHGVEFAGWVANSIDPKLERAAENLATLERILGRPPLAVFPFATAAGHHAPDAADSATTRAPATSGQTGSPATGDAKPASVTGPAPGGATGASVTSLAHPDVRCGEHIARRLSLIS
jgi:dethiobiotin synthetase